MARMANIQQGFSSKGKQKTVGPEANHMVVKNATLFLGPIQKTGMFLTIMLNV